MKEKEEKMCFVITKKGNTTIFERIGDDLEKDLLDYAFRKIQEKLHQHKVI